MNRKNFITGLACLGLGLVALDDLMADGLNMQNRNKRKYYDIKENEYNDFYHKFGSYFNSGKSGKSAKYKPSDNFLSFLENTEWYKRFSKTFSETATIEGNLKDELESRLNREINEKKKQLSRHISNLSENNKKKILTYLEDAAMESFSIYGTVDPKSRYKDYASDDSYIDFLVNHGTHKLSEAIKNLDGILPGNLKKNFRKDYVYLYLRGLQLGGGLCILKGKED